ncbi:uncharacterized protein LOC123258531 [Cotesia glomerata]|uniref:uncharacterized protein LOC123258531 n=1 Tax=Cotesia glomerata TaxID=32391 RepID=UPI001D02F590|nr:uncharacterized protein LOC123258531 [Cotesia glomerata]
MSVMHSPPLLNLGNSLEDTTKDESVKNNNGEKDMPSLSPQDTTSNEHTKTPEKTQTGNSKEQPPASNWFHPTSYYHPMYQQYPVQTGMHIPTSSRSNETPNLNAQTYNNGLITYAYPPMNYPGNGPPMQNMQPRQPPPPALIPPGLPQPRPLPAGNWQNTAQQTSVPQLNLPPRPARLERNDLPPFWPQHAKLWFSAAESAFSSKAVVDDDEKFRAVITKLEQEHLTAIEQLVTNPPGQNKYLAIKTALINHYSLSREESFRTLVSGLSLKVDDLRNFMLKCAGSQATQ